MLKKIMYKGIQLLPPKSDIIFKALMGDEKDKSLLLSFVNDVIGLNVKSENELEILNSEIYKTHKDDKESRLDLRVRLFGGEMIHIEIQIIDEKDIVPRSVFYHSQNLSRQIKAGEKYNNMSKTISLIIVDFNLFEDEELWYNVNRYMNIETGRILTDLSEICFLELPKVRKICLEKDSLNARERWGLFLSSEKEEELNMLTNESPVFEKAVKKLVKFSEEEKMQYVYDMREKAEMDYYSRIAAAEDRGVEQGMKQGMERGIKLGIERIAKSMKNNGIDNAVISEYSGLTIEEIEKL